MLHHLSYRAQHARTGLLLGACSFVLTGPVSVAATTEDTDSAAPTIQEVIVTAQKRESRILEVPAAISVISPDEMTQRRVTSVMDLDNIIPGLRAVQNTWQVNLVIRGIGNTFLGFGGESGVAFHEDGVYVGRASAQNSAFMDIERIEVLRGPQGTLYGRNATGGVINLITKRPTPEFELGIDVTAGNYGLVESSGFVSGPILADRVNGRLAVHQADRDGYGKNHFNGRDVDDLRERAVRGSLDFRLGDDANLLLSAEYYHAKDSSQGAHLASLESQAGTSLLPFPIDPVLLAYADHVTLPGLVVTPGGTGLDGGGPYGASAASYDVYNDFHPQRESRIFAASATLDWDLSASVNFRSISGYRWFDHDFAFDFDVSSLDAATLDDNESAEQVSQEFNFTWTPNDAVSVITGFYYFHEKLTGDNDVRNKYFPVLCDIFGGAGCPAPGGRGELLWQPFLTHFTLKGENIGTSLATYVHGEFALTERLSVIAAIRYSREKKKTDNIQYFEVIPDCNAGNPEMRKPLQAGCRIVGEETFRNWSPQGALKYQFSDDILLYASVGKGFKAGTFGFGNPGPFIDTSTVPTLAQAIVVPPETSTAYEVGIHGQFLDHRLNVSAAGFHYDYSNFQTTRLVALNVLAEAIDEASISGVEAEFRAMPWKNFELSGHAEYLHSEIGKYSALPNARGNPLQDIPEYSWMLSAKQSFDVPSSTLAFLASYRRTGTTYYDSLQNELTAQKPYGFVDASIQLESLSGSWTATLWAKNLTDEKAYSYKTIQAFPFGFPLQGGLFPPRTVGLQVGYRF